MRALTHIHTGHSWDSRTSPQALAGKLHERGVEMALISDHDSFAGALEVRRISAGEGLGLRVPVAAEIRTDCGDVIVIFEDEVRCEIAELKKWRRLPQVVRGLGGLIWLPHPFHHHDRLDELAAESDVIEIFNARCNDDENRRAHDLCRRHNKVSAFGIDAHLLRESGHWSVEYEAGPRLIDVLRHAPAAVGARPARQSDIYAAEVIHAVKRRRPAGIGYFSFRFARSRLAEVASRA